MQATRPLVRKRFGRIETDTPYSLRWVLAVRACVPSHYRSWDGAVWAFDPCCYRLVLAICEDEWGEGQVVDLVGEEPGAQFRGWEAVWGSYREMRAAVEERQGEDRWGEWAEDWKGTGRRRDPQDREPWERRPPRRPAPGARSPWDTLWLRPGAPREVVEAAYRALAKVHHPDRGGDVARMQEVNLAYEEIKRGWG